MYKKLTENEKMEIVTRYANGQAVASLCAEFNVSRSTMYSWINRCQTVKSSSRTNVTLREYYDLKRYTDKLEERLKIIKTVGYSAEASLQEKLAALEKLYGQYSVHALCDALDISRGTFYNHIFRRKDVTMYDKRREEMRIKIKDGKVN